MQLHCIARAIIAIARAIYLKAVLQLATLSARRKKLDQRHARGRVSWSFYARLLQLERSWTKSVWCHFSCRIFVQVGGNVVSFGFGTNLSTFSLVMFRFVYIFLKYVIWLMLLIYFIFKIKSGIQKFETNTLYGFRFSVLRRQRVAYLNMYWYRYLLFLWLFASVSAYF